MKSTARLLMLMLPMIALGGCATTKVVGNCPGLSAPPKEAVAALRASGSTQVDAWVVDLDRHYQKLDACAGR
jgi:hypothetical protein